jgi:hypothetical protein
MVNAFALRLPGVRPHHAWRAYERALERRPLATKVATSMVGFALGDALCQLANRPQVRALPLCLPLSYRVCIGCFRPTRGRHASACGVWPQGVLEHSGGSVYLMGFFGCRLVSGTMMLRVLRGWQLSEVPWEGRSGIIGSTFWTR